MTAVEPFGRVMDEADMAKAVTKAEMVEIVHRHCYAHGVRIVEDLLDHFIVKRKPYKERP